MLPVISQVCTLPSAFEQDLADYQAVHCAGMEVWLTKLEDFVARVGLNEAKREVAASGLAIPVASYQGGLFDGQPDRRAAAWELFSKRLSLCGEFGIGTLIVACDISESVSPSLIERLCLLISEAARRAGECGLRLAVEPQSKSTLGNNIDTLASVLDQVSDSHVGLCLDMFHFWVGTSKIADLGLLSTENLLHVQLCDLPGVVRELATDGDRILPGDGDLPVSMVVDHLREIGYTGAVSLETMNPQFWRVPTAQFVEIATTSLRAALGMTM